MSKTEGEIIFNTVNKGGEAVTPRWKPVKATNARCPMGHLMVVISGEVEYAVCLKCQQYYTPEVINDGS